MALLPAGARSVPALFFPPGGPQARQNNYEWLSDTTLDHCCYPYQYIYATVILELHAIVVYGTMIQNYHC